jgi:hypothetical protein
MITPTQSISDTYRMVQALRPVCAHLYINTVSVTDSTGKRTRTFCARCNERV